VNHGRTRHPKRSVLMPTLLLLLVATAACLDSCQKKKEPDYDTMSSPELEADFRNFIEQRRASLKQVLLDHGITLTNEISTADSTHHDWLEYRVDTFKDRKTGAITSSASVWIWGKSRFVDAMDLPAALMLNFDRRDTTWALLLEDGYLSEPRMEGEDKTGGHAPEVHAAIKELFPHHLDLARPWDTR
jgi:hypothetical protein